MQYRVALIDESRCIGCTKCLAVCPTDAIVGADRYMHTVITAECIGCELCLPPCPVDCIDMQPLAQKPFDDALARLRVKARKLRLKRRGDEREAERERRRATLKAPLAAPDTSAALPSDPVARALAAARAKRTPQS